MALRTYVKDEHPLDHEIFDKRQFGILGLQGSYHGDTIGAMNACSAGDGVYTCEWHDAKGYWLDPPTISMKKGEFTVSLPDWLQKGSHAGDQETGSSLRRLYNVPARLSSTLATHYQQHIEVVLRQLKESEQNLAALVLEPLILGAGGMRFVDPLFQRVLVDSVRKTLGIPVIFDEVFTGLYRVGSERASDILDVFPDISVNAKVLTGGLVPLAVTLATDKVFRSFWSENKADALLHGHSYSAYAVGCEVANETLTIIDELKTSSTWKVAQEKWQPLSLDDNANTDAWSFWSPEFVKVLSQQANIAEVMTLGTVLAFKIASGSSEGKYR
jgi:dethiobiotin synthetase/adenosylmethionine--8-amino-7-oxononanoate aminotransferase